MDNAAEPHDLVTVLLRLQGFEGMGREIGLGHSLMTHTWLPPTVGGQVFSKKCLHRSWLRGDPVGL